jgi:hypothetical protein
VCHDGIFDATYNILTTDLLYFVSMHVSEHSVPSELMLG